MSCSYLVGMFDTHFQRFTDCRTSVVIIIVKYIFGATLVVSCRKGYRIKGSMCSYVLDDLRWVAKCLSVWSQSSSITVHINFIDPTLNQISESSQQPSLIEPSWIAHCAVSTLKKKSCFFALCNAQSLPPRTVHFTTPVLKPKPWLPNCIITHSPLSSRTAQLAKPVLNPSA